MRDFYHCFRRKGQNERVNMDIDSAMRDASDALDRLLLSSDKKYIFLDKRVVEIYTVLLT